MGRRGVAILSWISNIGLCYLLGTFPSAYLAGKFLQGADIRALGDRNLGAANVWRLFGASAGITVFIVDCAKGIAAILLAKLFVDNQQSAMLGGLAAVAGHNWPAYLAFKGGRGASTLVGILLAIWPQATFPLLPLSGILLLLTRNSTVALGFFFRSTPLLAWLTGASLSFIGYSTMLMALVGGTHWMTVRRLPTRGHPDTDAIQTSRMS